MLLRRIVGYKNKKIVEQKNSVRGVPNRSVSVDWGYHGERSRFEAQSNPFERIFIPISPIQPTLLIAPRIFFFFAIITMHAQDEQQLSPFEIAVQEIAQQQANSTQNAETTGSQPSSESQSYFTGANSQEPHFLNYENCKKAIDLIALTSALIRVYVRYRRIYSPPADPGWLDQAWNAVCPSFIQNVGQHSRLFKDTLQITFETVMLKTAAKLVLFCWKGDAFDMMKVAGRKIYRFFRLLI